ncbi:MULTISPECIES: hypothetical protein [unclassified Paenibacillus]|uniref:hypothetical protein n=1 Tax=unclassified Paenibacillus TaxID=185978 RepID=UPI001AE1BA88|nr:MULTISPECIES: hypothetical protein [unclassified Paenibacillus]MBP1156161.1 putative DNA-binding ribbon-helix-helix protein [Paenibacillus sp. PvP091]MBP1168453.1 putative DNA-binding ribbon-helix-helix protein [Paenibacillus sp. PvR098]MBP2439481.1 putative DNA-binding ribbon-helix-helix protein [Paenibacillus sp. PvP052]
MKQTYAKKIIVSSLALALVLGGGALYGTKQFVRAETPDAAVQSQGNTDKPAEGKEWAKKGDNARGMHGKSMPIFEEAAAILGMDKETLKQSLKDKTLVQLAAEKKISEADLIAKLQAERTKKIDEALASGKLTAEKAEKLKQNMGEHLKFMVNHKLTGEEKKRMQGGKHQLMPAKDKLAGILGMTEDELRDELRAGKSLTEIAQSKGMTKEQLIGQIKDEMTPWIEKMVERKHSTGDKKTTE